MTPDPRRLTGLVGRDLLLRGVVEFEGALLVEGRITGEVRSPGGSGRLVLDRHGVIHGSVFVGEADIAGRVEGDVHAAVAVRVGREGHISGEIHAPRVHCEPGAQVGGEVRAGPAPTHDQAERPARRP